MGPECVSGRFFSSRVEPEIGIPAARWGAGQHERAARVPPDAAAHCEPEPNLADPAHLLPMALLVHARDTHDLHPAVVGHASADEMPRRACYPRKMSASHALLVPVHEEAGKAEERDVEGPQYQPKLLQPIREAVPMLASSLAAEAAQHVEPERRILQGCEQRRVLSAACVKHPAA